MKAMSPSHVENDVTLKPSIIPQRGGVSEAGDPTSAQGGRKNPRMWHVEGDVTFKPSIIFRPGFHQPKCQPQPATASRCEESTCHKSPCAACFSNDSRQECENNANKPQLRAASGAGQLTHNKPNQRPTPWLKTNHLGAAYRLPGPRHRWNPIWARTTQPLHGWSTANKTLPQPMPPQLGQAVSSMQPSIAPDFAAVHLCLELRPFAKQPSMRDGPADGGLSGRRLAQWPELDKKTQRCTRSALPEYPPPGRASPSRTPLHSRCYWATGQRTCSAIEPAGEPGCVRTWAERLGSVSSPLTGAVVESRRACWAGCSIRRRRHHAITWGASGETNCPRSNLFCGAEDSALLLG